MKETFQNIGEYFLEVLITTGYQLFILIGPLVLLAVLMNLVARYNEDHAINVFGLNGYLYGFGWLGTSVHELAHAFFALIFFHKIEEIKLFTPKMENGYLGYVSHSYNPNNFYQTIGNFFVGIAPILICPLLLILLTYLFFGMNVASLGTSFQFEFSNQPPFILTDLSGLWSSFLNFINLVFNGQNSSWWKLILFIYLFFTIGSSIALSKPDIKGALVGFYSFVFLLIILNLGTKWYGNQLTHFVDQLSQLMGVFYFVTILALMLNVVFLVIVQILSRITCQ